jgi:hypothetical protein
MFIIGGEIYEDEEIMFEVMDIDEEIDDEIKMEDYIELSFIYNDHYGITTTCY